MMKNPPSSVHALCWPSERAYWRSNRSGRAGLAALLLGLALGAHAQTTLQTESFETDGEGSRYTSNSFLSGSVDGSVRGTRTFNAYFQRVTETSSTQTISSTYWPRIPVSGAGLAGTYFWAGEGVRGPEDNPSIRVDRAPGYVQLNAVGVAGYRSLQVKAAFLDARYDHFAWEHIDTLKVQVRFGTSSPWVTVGQFVGDDTDDNAGLGAGNMRQDTNLNGLSSDAADASSPYWNPSMTDYTFSVPATGATLQTRILASHLGLSEEFGFDNIRVLGTAYSGSAPVLAGIESTTQGYPTANAQVALTSALTVSDADNTTLSSALVRFAEIKDAANDVLSFAGTSATGNIAGTFDASTRTLALTSAGSTATLAQWQAALRLVKFQTTTGFAAAGRDRAVLFAVTDPSGNASNAAFRQVGYSTAPANSAPTALSLSPQSVAENAGANATVGTFSTTDPDAGNTFTYALVSGTGSNDNASFTISGSTLRLTASADFETKSSYAIRVQTQDQGGLTFEQTFTINVTNVNEAPSIANQSRNIAENSATGTAVGAALTASDPDAGTTLTYSIVGGNSAGKFAISSGGQLTVAGALDFETTNSYTLTVQVSDGSLNSSATVTVNVTDVNEAPSIVAQSRSMAENSATGTSVGAAIVASDPDASTTLTYAITAGNTGGAFSFTGNQLKVANSAALDYETTPTFTLTVQVSDGSLTASNTVTVNLTNVNEAPVIAAQSRSVAENTAIGSNVGAALTASDPDAGTTLTYSITGGNSAGKFAINASTGQLTVAGALDYETTSSYSLTVRVSDGSLSSSATITVNILDVAEDLTVSGTANIPAGSYGSIIITSGGSGTVTGAITVAGSLTVQSGGSLNTNCQAITGAGSFTLQAGATLYICDNSGIMASGSSGAVQTTGTRSFSPDASYVYNGTAAQRTGSGLPAQVRNLTTTNASTLTLSQATSIVQVLTIVGQGNLVTNGQALTLLSDANGTALVVQDENGSIKDDVSTVLGTVTVQRYLDGSRNAGLGYRHFSTPVQNADVAGLATASFTPVINPDYNTSATPNKVTPFPTVFGYDQDRVGTVTSTYGPFGQGWVSPQSLTAQLRLGVGYAVNIAANQTVNFRGSITTGEIGYRLFRGDNAASGWHLVGNPYPAPLDWSKVAVSDRQGLEAAIYVVQSSGQYTGSYRSYVNGQSTTGTNNALLPVAQGFFVRVAAGNASTILNFRNSQRVTDYATAQGTSFQRQLADERPALRLRLTGGGYTDGWVAYAQAEATAGFDSEYDAAKLPNPSGLNLSSGASEHLAIDGQPAFTAATVLPLQVGVPAAGRYTLAAEALANLPAGLTAYLRDAATGREQALGTGGSYGFDVSASEATALLTGRFTLAFAPAQALAATPAALGQGVSLYPNPARAFTTLRVPAVAGASSVQVELRDVLGQLVLAQTAALPATGASLTVPTSGLAPGVYVLRLSAGAATATKRLTVE